MNTESQFGTGDVAANATRPQRLVSLDAFRGFIMVTLAAEGFGFLKTARKLGYWPEMDTDNLVGRVWNCLAFRASFTVCPVIKRIWTPAFTLHSGAWVLWMLALFYWVIDVRGVEAMDLPAGRRRYEFTRHLPDGNAPSRMDGEAIACLSRRINVCRSVWADD